LQEAATGAQARAAVAASIAEQKVGFRAIELFKRLGEIVQKVPSIPARLLDIRRLSRTGSR